MTDSRRDAHAPPMPAKFDLSNPLYIKAEMARAGLHDLMPWWSPDIDGMVNPMNDPDQQAAIRSFLGRLWRSL